MRGAITVMMACGAVLAGCAAVLWQRSGANAARRDGAALACEQPTKDFGEVETFAVGHTFRLTNPTARTLRITRVGKSCGCLQLKVGKRSLDPGEETSITISAEIIPKRAGAITRFHEEAALHTGDGPPLVLAVTGTYVPPLYYLVTSVGIEAPRRIGEPFEGKLELFLNRDRGVTIQQIEALGPLAFQAQVASRMPLSGTPYERVVLKVAGQFREGPLPQSGTLVIHTSSETQPKLSMPVVLRRPQTDEPSISPPRLAFGVLDSDQAAQRSVTVRLPASSTFAYESAASSLENLRVICEPLADGLTKGFELRCTFDPAGAAGAVDGELVLTLTDGATRQTYAIPISAFVK
jgi:hypothetical protein